MFKKLATFFIGCFILTYQITSAQTVNTPAVKHVLQDFHTCGLSSSPSVFKTPSGTISYYDFVSQLPNFYGEKGYFYLFDSYDKDTNSYRSIPVVAFVLNGFTPIEIGSGHTGRRGLVYVSIRADECQNIEINLGTKKLRIGRISAYLRLNGTEGALPPDEVYTAVSDWLVSHIIKKSADFNDNRQFIVFARPVSFSTQSTGELMDRMDIDFQIENYYIPEK